MKKIVVLLLVCTLCFAICSCTLVDNAREEVVKVENFIEKVVSIGSVETPEMALDKALELIHPESELKELTVDSIVEQVRENEVIKNLNIEEYPIEGFEMGDLPTPTLSFADETLGGNVYGLNTTFSITQVIDGQTVVTPIKVTIRLLSTDWGIGLYDFTIE